MKSKKIAIGIFWMIFIHLILYVMIPIKSLASDIVTIQCNDSNFYNGLLSNLEEKVQSKDDTAKTITMTKTDVESVTSIKMYNYGKPDEVQIIDITGIEEFTNLTNLDFSGNKISDISQLKGLTKLQSLDLFYNKIVDITPLENLIYLKALDLSWNDVNDISILSKLKNLEDLNLDLNDINNLKPLEGLKYLKSLSLYQAAFHYDNNIGDISALGNLTNLTNLNLHLDGIEDIQVLSNLTKLQTLDLSSNKISNISVLSELKNLENLNLKDNTPSTTIAAGGIKEVKLPSIILEAKNSSSKVYTEEAYTLENCTLSDDGTKIKMNTDEVNKATIKINGGIADGTKFTVNAVVGYVPPTQDEDENSDKTEQENIGMNENIDSNTTSANLVKKTSLPNAGYNKLILKIILIIAILGIIGFIKFRKCKDI